MFPNTIERRDPPQGKVRKCQHDRSRISGGGVGGERKPGFPGGGVGGERTLKGDTTYSQISLSILKTTETRGSNPTFQCVVAVET